ncbi:MAG: chorismate mutase [Eubacterium sp.]|nr:chorismate mutase [Eubacterium sp.]
MEDLKALRGEIEKIDKQMAALFEQRMQCAGKIADYKSENGMPILDEGREQKLIKKNEAYINEELFKPFYRQFMYSMLDISKQYQHTIVEKMRVAYSGIEGAFANIAAKKLFPDGELVSFSSFKKAYKAVTLGKCDVAVMPIENSAAGEVGQVLDLMFEGDLYVNGLYPLRISQNLLGVEGSHLSEIKRVISHPQALQQCSDYISEHGFEITESANTSIAAKQVADMGDKTIAAIASKETAGLYGLKLLDHDINEDIQNTTMFAVVSRNREEIINNGSGATVILMFSVKNEAGTLADAIGVIGKHGFSMNALRSRPLKSSPWQYYFYAEIDGRHAFDRIDSMLDEMSKYCETLKVLGASKENGEL